MINQNKARTSRRTLGRLAILGLSLVGLIVVTVSLLKPSEVSKPGEPLSFFLSSAPSEYFSKAERGRPLTFPDAHAEHPMFRQEWWYFTGNLQSSSGELFGYQLTFFRFSGAPHAIKLASEWQTSSTWMAHFTVTDVAGNQFFFADDFSRGAVALAGSRAAPFSVWVNSWSVSETDSRCAGCLSARVRAALDETEIDLMIESISPPVLQGDQGYSEKSLDGSVASHYYSYPSMHTKGTIRLDGIVHSVTGVTWMDREWSSAVLAKGQSGWDWFAFQLDELTRLMVFQVRDDNGQIYRTAHLMHEDGTNTIISNEHLSLAPKSWWQSPETGSRYPTEWLLTSTQPDATFSLKVTPQIQNQELDLAFRYYEGAVFVKGEAIGTEVAGQGYMELTGY